MSYAEDNNLDTYDVSEFVTLEDNWWTGYHETREGERIALRDMSTSHIQNTINFFDWRFDVTPLKEELLRRNHEGT